MFSFDQRSPCGKKEKMQSAKKKLFSNAKIFHSMANEAVFKVFLKMHLASARKPVLILEKKEAIENE